MVPVFYGSIWAATLLCSAIYIFVWHKHYNVNICLIFTFVPVTCLGRFLFSISRDLSEALMAQKVVYLGATFLQLFMLFSITDLCCIQLKRWIRALLLVLCGVSYTTALTMGYTDTFYKSISFAMVDGIPQLSRTYGWMHSAYYAVVFLFLAIGFFTICYAAVKSLQVPRTIITLLIIPYLFVLVSYLGGRDLFGWLDLMPVGYLLAQVMYLIISSRMNLYDVTDTVMDTMVNSQDITFVSFDFKYRYLGSDAMARQLFPELNELAVDDVYGREYDKRKLRHYLDSFKANPENNQFVYTLHSADGDESKDIIYNVTVSYLYDGSRKRGYMVIFKDDTTNRKYIRLLDTYNDELQEEVAAKTNHILEMHDNLIMSLATMVESRDNSTGGHIKRTSEGVRILVEEIQKEGKLSLTEEFCKDVIKAAPMHDLGKIAVDDAVLRKPGRFTDEEFEKMKKHAEEGARVIHEILFHTDDESFKQLAENIAHYHHERWDGSGYPEKLSGEQIPLEARIMAIADVYDALVSKRVYKEAYDFEKANHIILEGMGSQFDPSLQVAYENARPRLEEYYQRIADNS